MRGWLEHVQEAGVSVLIQRVQRVMVSNCERECVFMRARVYVSEFVISE